LIDRNANHIPDDDYLPRYPSAAGRHNLQHVGCDFVTVRVKMPGASSHHVYASA
jgi:hypothetical protein